MGPVVVCVQVGNYMNRGRQYVDNLYRMIERNSTVPFDFEVISDHHMAGYDCIPTALGGWWAKMELYRAYAVGRVVYFDLDTLITGNIDDILSYDGKPVFLGNWRDGGHPLSTAFMAFEGASLKPLWTDWRDRGYPMTRWGDDEFVRRSISRLGIDYAPAQKTFGGFGSYRFHKLGEGPKEHRVVCFCEAPKPHHLSGWASEVWHGEAFGASIPEPTVSSSGGEASDGAGVPVTPAPPSNEGENRWDT